MGGTSNQCAVCRWELCTDGHMYNQETKLTKQKCRLRISELRRRTVRELKFLAEQLGVNVADCLEKPEVVERIVASGVIEMSPEIQVAEQTYDGAAHTSQLASSEQEPNVASTAHVVESDSLSTCLVQTAQRVPEMPQALYKLLGKPAARSLMRTTPALCDGVAIDFESPALAESE